MSLVAGTALDEALGGGIVSKIDAGMSAGFSGAFSGVAADPSVEVAQDPVMVARNDFKGLVT